MPIWEPRPRERSIRKNRADLTLISNNNLDILLYREDWYLVLILSSFCLRNYCSLPEGGAGDLGEHVRHDNEGKSCSLGRVIQLLDKGTVLQEVVRMVSKCTFLTLSVSQKLILTL